MCILLPAMLAGTAPVAEPLWRRGFAALPSGASLGPQAPGYKRLLLGLPRWSPIQDVFCDRNLLPLTPGMTAL